MIFRSAIGNGSMHTESATSCIPASAVLLDPLNRALSIEFKKQIYIICDESNHKVPVSADSNEGSGKELHISYTDGDLSVEFRDKDTGITKGIRSDGQSYSRIDQSIPSDPECAKLVANLNRSLDRKDVIDGIASTLIGQIPVIGELYDNYSKIAGALPGDSRVRNERYIVRDAQENLIQAMTKSKDGWMAQNHAPERNTCGHASMWGLLRPERRRPHLYFDKCLQPLEKEEEEEENNLRKHPPYGKESEEAIQEYKGTPSEASMREMLKSSLERTYELYGHPSEYDTQEWSETRLMTIKASISKECGVGKLWAFSSLESHATVWWR